MEKPPSIMCEVCNGWHATAAHGQYEQVAREKRMAEIKARPDSAYNFEALGFEPESGSEIEQWMHEVIERAKDLGDDLQDSDIYNHFGPLESGRVPSVLSMVTQNSFTDGSKPIRDKNNYNITEGITYLAHYNKGEAVSIKTQWSGATDLAPILELQERWIKSQQEGDLKKYQDGLTATLINYIGHVEELIGESIDEELKQTGKDRIENAKKIIDTINTTNGRREAMDFIATRVVRGVGGRNLIGVVFSVGDTLQQDVTTEVEKVRHPYPSTKFHTQRTYKYRGENVITISPQAFSGDVDNRASNLQVISPDTPAAQEFYKNFIHALYIPGGSVEVQRNVLQRLLEVTKDCPERRLPIYNFYGKLVWPRPPKTKD